MKDQQYEKKEIIKHLRSAPIVSVACGKSGVSRATYYRWCEDDPKFKNRVTLAIQIGNRGLNDLAKGKLIKKIQEENLRAVTFQLSRCHPEYVNRDKDRLKRDIKNNEKEIVIDKEFKISKEAYEAVRISKLPKRLRRRVVKKGLRMKHMLESILKKVHEERGGYDRADREVTIEWAEMLKLVLEEDNTKKYKPPEGLSS